MGVSRPGRRGFGPIRRRSEFIAGEGIAGGSGGEGRHFCIAAGRGTYDVGLQLYWAGENEHGREAAERESRS